jgi:hypothetical protein
MERLTMRQTREILRLRWVVGLSVREVSRATGTSTGVASKTVHRAETARLTWERVDALTDPSSIGGSTEVRSARDRRNGRSRTPCGCTRTCVASLRSRPCGLGDHITAKRTITSREIRTVFAEAFEESGSVGVGSAGGRASRCQRSRARSSTSTGWLPAP